MSYMGTAAKLDGEISHGNNADLISVFLTEESHGTCLLGILDAHDPGIYSKILCDLLIDDLFYLRDLFRCHCLIMGKVKTKASVLNKGSGLLHMISQHHLQGLLEQMCCGMVIADLRTTCSINGKRRSLLH